MIELLTSMWGYLAGAGVIGLILGWAFRGVFLPRARTINVTAPAPAALERPLTEAQQQALEKAEGNITQAAKILGISRSQMAYKIKKA